MDTLVLDFTTDSATAAAALELDPTRNLDDDGNARSQFYPGDEVWLRLRAPAGYTPVAVEATDGGAALAGAETQQLTETKYFEQTGQEEGAVTLTHPPDGSIAAAWQGNQGHGLTHSGNRAWITTGAPALGQLTYPVTFYLIRYTPPPMTLADGDQRQFGVRVYLETS